jgi:hypothetical protein
MFIAQSAAHYTQFRDFCEISHSFQDLFPLFRDASVQYKLCDLSVDICEVLCCECDIAESKYVIDRRCHSSIISVVGVIGLIGQLVDGLHISVNGYNSIHMAINKVLAQNRGQIVVFVLVVR